MSEMGLQDGRRRFDSPNFGFTMKVPNGWKTDASASKVEFTGSLTGGNEYLTVSYVADSSGNEVVTAAEEYVFNELAPYDNSYKYEGMMPAKMGGKTAVYLIDTRERDGKPVKGMHFMVIQQGLVYMMRFEAPENIMAERKAYYLEMAAAFEPRTM